MILQIIDQTKQTDDQQMEKLNDSQAFCTCEQYHYQVLLLSYSKTIPMNNHFYNSSPLKFRDNLNSDQRDSPSSRQNHQQNKVETQKEQVVDVKTYTINNCKFIKHSPLKNNEYLPPKATPFQRSKRLKSRDVSFKDRSSSNVSNLAKEKEDEIKDSRNRADSASRVTDLKKRISQEIAEKQKWKESSQANAQKIAKLSQELAKLRQNNKWYQEEMDRVSKNNYEVQNELRKANQAVENLQKTININAIHLNSIKQKETELQHLKNQIKKLAFENQSLVKTISAMKVEIQKKNVSNFQEECIKKSEIIVGLQREIEKLKMELKAKEQTEKMLQANLGAAERVLYQKEGQLKKVSIHLNFLGRKQAMSIDDVRSKKDLEIKIIRDKYNKATKDLRELRESKGKEEKVEKKKISKQKDIIRKVKSQKHIRMGESDQFTFQLSSET